MTCGNKPEKPRGGNSLNRSRLATATVLVLASAPARAGLVAADFRRRRLHRRGTRPHRPRVVPDALEPRELRLLVQRPLRVTILKIRREIDERRVGLRSNFVRVN